MTDSRFIIGIDLGTTNCAVFYLDLAGDGQPRHFMVPQVSAPGEVRASALLPSFLYLPGEGELAAGALALPWEPSPSVAVGSYARDYGATAPGRLVSSAKSWLAHAGVDRTRAILPWGAELGERMLSPVAAGAAILRHLRAAWDARFGQELDRDGSPCTLAEQQVVITIPASFDQAARDLTLQAARLAGYGPVLLLEEPLAAFYAWLWRHAGTWREELRPGERVLVIDVGGGTSDFSFMVLDEAGTLKRLAVGEHLLLGGDNMDMALARELEQGWGERLGPIPWAALVQQCRQAKEALLEGQREQVPVTLLGRGSSVLRGAKRGELRRERVLQVLREGFYPPLPADAPGPRERAGMRQMGLPYAQDPAITRHLLQFLRYAARVEAAGGQAGPERGALLYPHRVLFNGGSMKAPAVREWLLAALASWFPELPAPRELPNADLDLAVAQGAAYYGGVRLGHGVRVKGGIAHAYYLEVGASDGRALVCVMARDTDENVPVTVPGRFQVIANEQVRFPLLASAVRLHDQPGARCPLGDEFSQVAPLVSLLRYGKGERQALEVRLETRLTEVGTLEVAVVAPATGHRWPLHFELRPPSAEVPPAPGTSVVLAAAPVRQAQERLRARLAGPGESLANLVAELESDLALPREDWPLPVLRALGDTLLTLKDQRGRSLRHEQRWLNLTGYCLRPGLGELADELRLKQAWALWFEGPKHPRDAQVQADWWVFWRRLAPGLKRGHQNTLAEALAKLLYPREQYREHLREGDQARREAWRCLAALESLPPARKQAIGRLLLARLSKLSAWEYWVLARLGARHPFHASADLVLPAKEAASWLAALCPAVASGADGERLRGFAISRLAALTGDRALDLPEAAMKQARATLAKLAVPASWRTALDTPSHESREDAASLLGDSLPLGLEVKE